MAGARDRNASPAGPAPALLVPGLSIGAGPGPVQSDPIRAKRSREEQRDVVLRGGDDLRSNMILLLLQGQPTKTHTHTSSRQSVSDCVCVCVYHCICLYI